METFFRNISPTHQSPQSPQQSSSTRKTFSTQRKTHVAENPERASPGAAHGAPPPPPATAPIDRFIAHLLRSGQWRVAFDPDCGRPYYYCVADNTTTWDLAAAVSLAKPDEPTEVVMEEEVTPPNKDLPKTNAPTPTSDLDEKAEEASIAVETSIQIDDSSSFHAQHSLPNMLSSPTNPTMDKPAVDEPTSARSVSPTSPALADALQRMRALRAQQRSSSTSPVHPAMEALSSKLQNVENVIRAYDQTPHARQPPLSPRSSTSRTKSEEMPFAAEASRPTPPLSLSTIALRKDSVSHEQIPPPKLNHENAVAPQYAPTRSSGALTARRPRSNSDSYIFGPNTPYRAGKASLPFTASTPRCSSPNPRSSDSMTWKDALQKREQELQQKRENIRREREEKRTRVSQLEKTKR